MADAAERKVWERQEGEPNEAYARFLVYRNLGPTRTIDIAYQIVTNRKKSASGQWRNECTRFNWRNRATQWDAAQLVNVVPEAATTIFRLIGETARTCLDEITSGRIKPNSFDELKEMVTILAGFISPEVISATIDNAGHSENSEKTTGGNTSAGGTGKP